jgi:hypothetical protein
LHKFPHLIKLSSDAEIDQLKDRALGLAVSPPAHSSHSSGSTFARGGNSFEKLGTAPSDPPAGGADIAFYVGDR